jgi:hypothetical protein
LTLANFQRKLIGQRAMPNQTELTALLDRLRAEPRETEWLEFKTNRFGSQVLGEYLSALANTRGSRNDFRP